MVLEKPIQDGVLEFYALELGTNDGFVHEKSLDLKSMLNLGVCLSELFTKEKWAVTLRCCAAYCSIDAQVRKKELEEFKTLHSSFLSLFEASKEFDSTSLDNFVSAFSDLLVTESSKTPYGLLEKCTVALVRANYPRLMTIWAQLAETFDKMVASEGEQSIRLTFQTLAEIGVFLHQIERPPSEINSSFRDGSSTFSPPSPRSSSGLSAKRLGIDNEAPIRTPGSNAGMFDKCFALIRKFAQNLKAVNSALTSMLKMIEPLAFDFEPETWRLLIEFVYSTIKPQMQEEQSQLVFEFIQKVKSNYLSCLNSESMQWYLDLMKIFEACTESKGLRYGIVEFILPTSDSIARKFLNDSSLWTRIFEFLEIGASSREPDIRNTSISLFAGISSGGVEFTGALWRALLEEHFLPVFEKCFDVYFHLLRDEKGRALPDTPEYILSMKDDFEGRRDKRLSKTPLVQSEKEPEALTLQWIETLKILIQSFHKLLTLYLGFEAKEQEIIEALFEKSFTLFRVSNKFIFGEVPPVIRTFFTSASITSTKKRTFFEEILLWLKINPNQGQAAHDLMTLVSAGLADSKLIADQPTCRLLLALLAEEKFYPAFAAEYSTFFYNLESLTKEASTRVFSLASGNPEFASALVASLPLLYWQKASNPKAITLASDSISAAFTALRSARSSEFLSSCIAQFLSILETQNTKTPSLPDSWCPLASVVLTEVTGLVKSRFLLQGSLEVISLTDCFAEKFAFLTSGPTGDKLPDSFKPIFDSQREIIALVSNHLVENFPPSASLRLQTVKIALNFGWALKFAQTPRDEPLTPFDFSQFLIKISQVPDPEARFELLAFARRGLRQAAERHRSDIANGILKLLLSLSWDSETSFATHKLLVLQGKRLCVSNSPQSHLAAFAEETNLVSSGCKESAKMTAAFFKTLAEGLLCPPAEFDIEDSVAVEVLAEEHLEFVKKSAFDNKPNPLQ